VKFAVCNETFQGWTFEKTCEYVAQVGYDGLEVAPFTLAESAADIPTSRRAELLRCLKANGLEMVGLHWLLASPKGLYLNHPDVSIRKRTTEYLKTLLNFCSDLGGKIIVFGSPKQRNVHPDLDAQTAWKYAVEGFASVLGEAEHCGVLIAIEPLSPKETDFVNTAEDAVKMIRELDHPNFRLHLDVKAMSSENVAVDDLIRRYGEWMVHFHANDANLRGPGFGDVDYAPIAKALRDIGYAGYISVEVFDYEPDAQIIATQSLEYLRRHLL